MNLIFIEKIDKKGVTLLELIIIMVIIAIGAVLVAPNIVAWIPHYHLRSATRDIVSMMRTAQMKAVSKNLEYGVLFDNQRFSIKRGNLSSNSTSWDDEGVAQTLPAGITIVQNTLPINTSAGGRFAEFNPDSTSSSGSVTLRNSRNSTRQVVLSPTGRIRIE